MVSNRLRHAAHALLALAAGLGLWLFAEGLLAQWGRFQLNLRQGLGFADPYCTTGYCDYAMFWAAGFLARHGQAALLYHHAAFAAAAARILPYASGWWPFVYPPVLLLPASVLSAAPLAAGYYTFSALAAGIGIWLLRRAGIAWWCILAGLASPAMTWNLYLGQLGLSCGALLLFGLARLHTRPLQAGALLGLLCVKPQYALLVPVAVLAGRHKRALLAGAVVTMLCLLASLACFGWPAWSAYLGPGRAEISALLTQPFGGYQSMGTSVFWMLRSLHAPLGPAYAAQAAASLAAAAFCWRLWARAAPGRPPVAATIFLTLLASPYGFTDDLTIYSILLPGLARHAAPWRNALLAWLWLAPAFVPKFVAMFGFLPTPLMLICALALAGVPFRLGKVASASFCEQKEAKKLC